MPSDRTALIHVGAGIYAPSRIHLGEGQVLPNDSGFEIAADLALEDGRYVIERLTVTRTAGGPAVTGEGIRRIAVQELIGAAVASAVGPKTQDGEYVPLRFTDAELAALRDQGPTDATLEQVAKLYVIGRLLGNAPARNVASVLEIPLPTANNWIRRAKDRGHLGPYLLQRLGDGDAARRRIVTRYQASLAASGDEPWVTIVDGLTAVENFAPTTRAARQTTQSGESDG